MVRTKEEILNLLRKNRDKTQDFGVKRIALFGSFVHNKQTDKSDVDFVVEFEEGEKTFDNFMGLNSFLEDLLDRRVEILTLDGMNSIRVEEVANDIKKSIEYV